MSLRSLSAQWTATAYVGGVSLALNILLARLLGPSDFGHYGVALAAGALLAVFLDGGFRNLLLRERTRVTAALADVKPHLHAVAVGHAVAVAALAAAIGLMLSPDVRMLGIATVACFLGVVLTQLISSGLRGEGRFGADAAWQIGARTLSAAVILLALAAGADKPAGVLLAWAIGSLLALVFLPHGQNRGARFEWHSEVYRTTVFLMWIELATVIYFRSDMLLMQALGVPADQIGHYAAAYRLVEAVILAFTPIALLIFRNVRLELHNPARLRRRLIMMVSAATVAGTAITALFTATAQTLIPLVYGARYAETAGLLEILAAALIFILPNAVLTQAAVALNREKAYAIIATLAAGLNLGLNAWLIPQHGPAAAAWVTVATEAGVLIMLAGYLSTQVRHGSLEPVVR